MTIITAIEEQKKNKNRVSIFLDGEFFKGVSQEVILKLNLFKGKKINQNELSEILEIEEFEHAKSLTLKYLSYKPRTSFEITKYLKKKNTEGEVIKKIIKEIENLGLINDDEYARQYASELIRKGKAGYNVIVTKLIKRGISVGKAKNLLNNLFKEGEELKTAFNLAEKKFKTIKHKEKQKIIKSINDFLIRKGFNFEIVNKVIRKLWRDYDESDS